MVNNKKSSFPLMPISHWWTLRTKFQQSIPGVVTDSYIATVLNMKEASARGNILPYLTCILGNNYMHMPVRTI